MAYQIGQFLDVPVAILAAGAVIYAFLAWRRGYWSLIWRIHCTLVTLGAVVVVQRYLNWKILR